MKHRTSKALMREIRSRDGGRGTGDGAVPRFFRVIRQLFGAPDYQAYLEHCSRAGHPPRLSEREYVSEFFEQKARTPRCC
jgi:uncharacterized short protein YbdD (DUF466 family)